MITIQRRGIVDTYNGYSFSRPSTAFDSSGRLALPGNARFESIAGRRGVRVEEATTNRLGADSSSFEGGWGIWSPHTAVRASDTAWHGSYAASLRRTVSSGFQAIMTISRSNAIPVSESTAYTWSLWYRISPNRLSLQPVFRVWALDSSRNDLSRYTASGSWGNDDSLGRVSLPSAPPDGVWRRFELPMAPTPAGTAYLRVDIFEDDGGLDEYGWIDGIQLEQRAYPTSWQLGGFSRSPESLTIPTEGVLGPGAGFAWDQGTVEMWAYVLQEEMVGGSRPRAFLLFRAGTTSNTAGFFDFYHRSKQILPEFLVRLSRDSDGTVQFGWNPASPLPTGWHLFALTWDRSGDAKFYVDGVLRAQASIAGKSLPIQSSASIAGDAVNGWLNNLLGPIRISRRARTDQEIADAYAGGYFEADADTTLLLPLDGPDAQRAAKTVVI